MRTAEAITAEMDSTPDSYKVEQKALRAERLKAVKALGFKSFHEYVETKPEWWVERMARLEAEDSAWYDELDAMQVESVRTFVLANTSYEVAA